MRLKQILLIVVRNQKCDWNKYYCWLWNQMSLTHSVSDWQGHLLSCPGQLKKGPLLSAVDVFKCWSKYPYQDLATKCQYRFLLGLFLESWKPVVRPWKADMGFIKIIHATAVFEAKIFRRNTWSKQWKPFVITRFCNCEYTVDLLCNIVKHFFIPNTVFNTQTGNKVSRESPSSQSFSVLTVKTLA